MIKMCNQQRQRHTKLREKMDNHLIQPLLPQLSIIMAHSSKLILVVVFLQDKINHYQHNKNSKLEKLIMKMVHLYKLQNNHSNNNNKSLNKLLKKKQLNNHNNNQLLPKILQVRKMKMKNLSNKNPK